MLRFARFSSDRLYRYRLARVWDDAAPRVLFVMLNPSTADARRDDPTIRRCIGFARRWGFGGLEAVNLFAYRATSPRRLFAAADPVGPRNDRHIRAAAAECARIILAWGNHATRWVAAGGEARADTVLRILRPFGPLHCLGLTRLGQPGHPLYVSADRQPISLARQSARQLQFQTEAPATKVARVAVVASACVSEKKLVRQHAMPRSAGGIFRRTANAAGISAQRR